MQNPMSDPEQAARSIAAELVAYFSRPEANEAQRVCLETIPIILLLAEKEAEVLPRGAADALIEDVGNDVASLRAEAEVALPRSAEDVPAEHVRATMEATAHLYVARAKVMEDRAQARIAAYRHAAWERAIAGLQGLRRFG